MSREIASLYGEIFQDLKHVRFMFFSDDDFDRWFSMKEAQVAKEIRSKLQLVDESTLMLPSKVPFDGFNHNLILEQGKQMIVYSWTLPNGSHPLRWQSRDDLSEFVNSLS